MKRAHRQAVRAVRAVVFHHDLVSIGCPIQKAKTLTARRYRLSVPTVERYLAKTKGRPEGEWLQALFPRYKGRVARAPISPEAWSALITSYSPERVARSELKGVIERIRVVAKLQGWQVPSTQTLRRRLREFLRPKRSGV